MIYIYIPKQALFGNLHYSLTEVRPSNGSALNINAVIYVYTLKCFPIYNYKGICC